MRTELERLKVLSALKLGYGKLTAKNTTEAEFKNIEDAIEIVKNCFIPDVVKSLPNDEEVKAHIDTMSYYGTCTTEYNEGFEDGAKWLKEQMAK